MQTARVRRRDRKDIQKARDEEVEEAEVCGVGVALIQREEKCTS